MIKLIQSLLRPPEIKDVANVGGLKAEQEKLQSEAPIASEFIDPVQAKKMIRSSHMVHIHDLKRYNGKVKLSDVEKLTKEMVIIRRYLDIDESTRHAELDKKEADYNRNMGIDEEVEFDESEGFDLSI